MEMVRLLWWNTTNNIHTAEFHIMKHLRMYTELSEHWLNLPLMMIPTQGICTFGHTKPDEVAEFHFQL
jgi:hypothetical protein